VRYFITGVTGFIGRRLALDCLAAGHEVVAIARNPKRARDLISAGVDVRPGDVTDRESMRAPMTGVDGCFHIAGWYKLGERDTTPGQRVNVDGTRNVLQLMRELKIPRGVYTSSLAVYSDTRGRIVDESYRFTGTHLTEYDRTKAIAHYDVAAPMVREGLPLITVLPGVVYGPGDTSTIHDTFVQYLRRRLLVIPAGTAFSWGYIDDTARGHMQAMTHGVVGESYILAGPVHTLAEALDMAARITGIPAPRVRVPATLMNIGAAATARIERVVPLPSTYRSEVMRASAGVTYVGSSEKAQRELGFSTRPLEEGLRLTLPPLMDELGIPRPT
jgi:nucleoside-diphosphate-sugar epimerase